MKKNVFFVGMPAVLLALGLVVSVSLALAGCDNGTTDNSSGGKLTITGLEDINGKYVIAVTSSSIGTSTEAYGLMGMGDSQKNTGILVSNSKVELNVYKVTPNYEKQQMEASSYSGSDSNVKFSIYWKNTNSFVGWSTGNVTGITKFGEVTVSFTTGSAQGQAQEKEDD
jgi:hypothetical protein